MPEVQALGRGSRQKRVRAGSVGHLLIHARRQCRRTRRPLCSSPSLRTSPCGSNHSTSRHGGTGSWERVSAGELQTAARAGLSDTTRQGTAARKVPKTVMISSNDVSPRARCGTVPVQQDPRWSALVTAADRPPAVVHPSSSERCAVCVMLRSLQFSPPGSAARWSFRPLGFALRAFSTAEE